MAHLTDAVHAMVTEQLSPRQSFINGIKHAAFHIRDAKEWADDSVNFGDPKQKKELRRISKEMNKLRNRLTAIQGTT